MYFTSIRDAANSWVGFRVSCTGDRSDRLWINSGGNYRSIIGIDQKSLAYTTTGADYWGVWLLVDSDISSEVQFVPPIRAAAVPDHGQEDAQYWCKYFLRAVFEGSTPLFAQGQWHVMLVDEAPTPYYNRVVIDVQRVFPPDNLHWIDWGVSGGQSLVALKPQPATPSCRVKYYRKLVRNGSCPPLLAWNVRSLDTYLLIDGHCRLLANKLEERTPRIVTLTEVATHTPAHPSPM